MPDYSLPHGLQSARLSMEFSREEYWSGVPFPPPGDFPEPGIKPTSLVSSALVGGFFTANTSWEAHKPHYTISIIEKFCKM